MKINAFPVIENSVLKSSSSVLFVLRAYFSIKKRVNSNGLVIFACYYEEFLEHEQFDREDNRH